MDLFQTHSTPNPNSIKITTSEGSFIEDGMAAFNSAEEATGHPLGEKLFHIAGIENVLIMPDFVTISKTPGGSWDHIMRKVKRVLREHLGHADEE